MSDGLQPLATTGITSAALDRDVACRRCAYNLRGLREDGRCPECGTPVGLSLRGFMLCYADPDWVDKIVRGLTLILWMILASIVVGVCARLIGVDEPLAKILELCVNVISLYGAWLMTAPDPSGIGEDPNLTARKVVRVGLLAGLSLNALGILLETPGINGTLQILLGILSAIAGLGALAGEFAKFIYYQRLAERIPNPALAGRASFLKWAFTIAFGLIILAGALAGGLSAAGGAGAAGGSVMMVAGCLVLPAGVAFLVFGLMTLLLLIRLRRELAAQARLARATWHAQPATQIHAPAS
jgi:hypothetical protein